MKKHPLTISTFARYVNFLSLPELGMPPKTIMVIKNAVLRRLPGMAPPYYHTANIIIARSIEVPKSKIMKILICTIFAICGCLFSPKTLAQGPPSPGGDPLDTTVIKKPIVEIFVLQPSTMYLVRNNNEVVVICADDSSQTKLKIVGQLTAANFCNTTEGVLQQQQNFTVSKALKNTEYIYFNREN